MQTIDIASNVTSEKVILWRLWDALGSLNAARDYMLEASIAALEDGRSGLEYSYLRDQICELGKSVGILIEREKR